VDDQAVIARVLAGERDEFEVLVQRHQKALHAFVFRQLRDRDAADEVVQMSFVRAYTNLARFRGDASFRTWLHQIALNLCRAEWRQRRRAPQASVEEIPEPSGPSGDAGSDPRQVRLRGLVERLPPRQRSVLAMRVYADMPFKEIAQAVGISENSAKVNFHHAVTRLKEWLTR